MKPVYLFLICLVGMILLSLVLLINKNKMNQLSFSPANISVSAGTEFSVDVVLDTGGVAIDGVDVILPLQGVVFADLAIIDNHLLPNTMTSSVENGIVTFSQVTTGGNHFTGSGSLFTLKLKASTDATLNFDWTPGSTNKTVVAANGENIITSLGSLQITIVNVTPITAIHDALQAIVNIHGGELVGTYTPPPVIPPPIPGTPMPFDVKKA